jgi:hypothetical protein
LHRLIKFFYHQVYLPIDCVIGCWEHYVPKPNCQQIMGLASKDEKKIFSVDTGIIRTIVTWFFYEKKNWLKLIFADFNVNYIINNILFIICLSVGICFSDPALYKSTQVYSYHKTNIIILLSKIKLFSPQYSRKIAHLA